MIGLGLSIPQIAVRRGAGGGGGPEPAFDPASLNADLWLDPDDLATLSQTSGGSLGDVVIGDPAGRLEDKSGNDNHVIQTDAGSRPVLQELAGARYLAFDGDDDSLLGPAISNIITADTADIIIAGSIGTLTTDNANSYANDCFFRDSVEYFGLYTRSSSGGLVGAYNWDGTDDHATTAYTAGQVSVIHLRHSGGQLSITVDDGPTVSVASGNTSDISGSLMIGRGGPNFADLNFYGMIARKTLFDETELANLKAYYAAKIAGEGFALTADDQPLSDDDIGVTVDLVTDFAGDFAAFNTFYAAQTVPVKLTIPAGTYTDEVELVHAPDLPLPGVIIEGVGTPSLLIKNYNLQPGSTPALLSQPRFQTASAGQTTITLVEASEHSFFAVGDWVILGAVEMQSFGYPQNFFTYEYKKVLAKDTVAGVLTLNEPLRYSYKSTYPLIRDGAPDEVDLGGPATVYRLPKNWDHAMTIRGIRVLNAVGQVWEDFYGHNRVTVWEDCTFDEINPSATVCKRFIQRNCVFGATRMETDKLVDRFESHDCTGNILEVQSASVNLAIHVGDQWDQMTGTGTNTHLSGCDIGTLRVGPIAYGAAKSLVINDSTVDAMTYSANRVVPLSIFTGPVAGMLTCSRTDFLTTDAILDIVPGISYYFTNPNGNGNLGHPFLVTDITESGADILVHTTLGSTMPTPEMIGGGIASHITPHPCHAVRASGSVGCADVVSMSADTTERRLWSYYNSGEVADPEAFPEQPLWGNIVSFRVNVIRAYTGAQPSALLHAFSQFGGICEVADEIEVYDPVIDLTIAGERVITPSGVTGAQSGDAGLTMGNVWSAVGIAPYLGVDMSGDASEELPIVQIIATTQQAG